MPSNQVTKYAPLFKYLNKFFDIVAGLTSLLLLTVVILQILARSLSISIPWTEELTRYIFIWMIFMGIGIGFRKAESPRVTVLLNIMPKVINFITKWIYAISTIGFLIFMIVYGIGLVQEQIAVNETSSVLLIPLWVVGIIVPVSGAVGIISVIQSLIYHRDLL